MAEIDLIAGYLDDLRRSLRWRPDADDLLLELEDHLRSKADSRRRSGVVAAERETIDEFGSALEVARSFAVTPTGGLAVPTVFTQRAGTVGLVAGAVWMVSMVIGFVGQGELLVPWTAANYQLWSLVTGLAAVVGTVALAGILARGGGGRDLGTILALGLCLLGVLGTIVATWAWVVLFLPFAVAGVVALRRLRSCGLASRASYWLAAAWPVGAVLGFGLDALRLGHVDEYGDYPLARVIGYTIASTLWALALATVGLTLRREQPVRLFDGGATA